MLTKHKSRPNKNCRIKSKLNGEIFEVVKNLVCLFVMI